MSSGCCVSIVAPTTITQSGNYRLANDIAGGVVIAADNVTFNLEGKIISGGTTGIQIGAFTNITIKNGTVDNASAKGIEAIGSSDIQMLNVKLKNNGNGVSLSNVNGGLIKSCLAANNSIGIELNQSSKLHILECVAQENSFAGFSLHDSANNTVKNCCAIANGTNGTDSAFGFISDNGHANIFEQCNAQSTITTQTTIDFLAAGFALITSEECSKIINCESFNNTTSITGLATSYGISLEAAGDLTIVTTNNPTSSNIFSVNWSPNGQFLAAGTFIGIVVYSFDGNILTIVDTDNPGLGTINSVNWSPDGNFLAAGANDGTVVVYSFDGNTLTIVDTDNPALNDINSVNWSPDGNFLAVGTLNSVVVVYSFDGSTLTIVDTDNPGLSSINSVNWSPDGNFLAAGTTSGTVVVYSFDGSTLTIVDTDNPALNDIFSVNWSPDGTSLVAGASNGTVVVYSFDGSSLALVDTDNPGFSTIESVNWSPDGSFIAVGTFNSVVVVYSFEGGLFPAINNIIKNNIVYCNQNPSGNGVGISGSSTSNLIIGNTAFQNDINYENVTNVFSGGVNGDPTLLQNVSVPPF